MIIWTCAMGFGTGLTAEGGGSFEQCTGSVHIQHLEEFEYSRIFMGNSGLETNKD